MKAGQKVIGYVSDTTDFAAFVDVGVVRRGSKVRDSRTQQVVFTFATAVQVTEQVQLWSRVCGVIRARRLKTLLTFNSIRR